MALTRQTVPQLDRSNAKDPGVARGALYSRRSRRGVPDAILIGAGSEVSLCVMAREQLKNDGVKARVVSMPSWNLFTSQPESYQESVLPRRITKRVTIEAASTIGWHRWAGDEGVVIGLEHFGASAPGSKVLEHAGFKSGTRHSRRAARVRQECRSGSGVQRRDCTRTVNRRHSWAVVLAGPSDQADSDMERAVSVP